MPGDGDKALRKAFMDYMSKNLPENSGLGITGPTGDLNQYLIGSGDDLSDGTDFIGSGIGDPDMRTFVSENVPVDTRLQLKDIARGFDNSYRPDQKQVSSVSAAESPAGSINFDPIEIKGRPGQANFPPAELTTIGTGPDKEQNLRALSRGINGGPSGARQSPSKSQGGGMRALQAVLAALMGAGKGVANQQIKFNKAGM